MSFKIKNNFINTLIACEMNIGKNQKTVRGLDQTTLEKFRKKFPDAVVSGHPDNMFRVGFRLSSEKSRMFRSYDLHPVEGGGLIIQSSWYEDGQPALSMIYRWDLALEKRRYQDTDGNIQEGVIVTRQRFALWRWLFRVVLGI